MLLRKFQTRPPAQNLPLPEGQILNIAAAAGSTEAPIFYVAQGGLKAAHLYLGSVAGITGNGTNYGNLFFNLWRANKQVVGDGFLGALPFNNAAQVLATGATAPVGLGPWLYVATTGAALTAGTSTAVTLTGIGVSAANPLLGLVGASLIVDPGLATQETIPFTGYTVSGATATIAAGYNGGKFAVSHLAGALAVIGMVGKYAGVTGGAITAGTTTTIAVTSTLSGSYNPVSASTDAAVLDYGLATQETIPAGSYTFTSNNLAPAAGYNGGKFAVSHASGGSVVFTGPTSLMPLQAGDLISAKYTQAGTGLALTNALVTIDYDLA